MTNLPNLIPETLFGVPWADNTTPAGAWAIASSSAAAIRNGFANGASFNSLSAGLPGFSAPNINSFIGTFKTPQYQEWSLQFEQQLDDKSSTDACSMLATTASTFRLPTSPMPSR